ncbi:pectin lyase fold/virulence factor [Mycena galericulata]|nr:pectin lyase fold/virulence factor [Mycena galericulata]
MFDSKLFVYLQIRLCFCEREPYRITSRYPAVRRNRRQRRRDPRRCRPDLVRRLAANASLLRPITLTLFQATDVLVQDITMLNSPEWFNFVNEGKNVTFANVSLRAASTSANGPSNTDGWDVYRRDQVTLRDSVIDNGDDCVSFKPNTTNTFVSNLNCTGSHGISVGSLGQFAGVFDIVENVTSVNTRMSNAQNGPSRGRASGAAASRTSPSATLSRARSETPSSSTSATRRPSPTAPPSLRTSSSKISSSTASPVPRPARPSRASSAPPARAAAIST